MPRGIATRARESVARDPEHFAFNTRCRKDSEIQRDNGAATTRTSATWKTRMRLLVWSSICSIEEDDCVAGGQFGSQLQHQLKCWTTSDMSITINARNPVLVHW